MISLLILSSVFTGCGKSYDTEIDGLIDRNIVLSDSLQIQQAQLEQIRQQVQVLQAALTTVQTTVNGLKTITNIITNDDGSGYVIQFNTGNPITISNGTSGTVWTIGTDSFWYNNGQRTDQRAIPRDGINGTPTPVRSPGINSVTGEWELYEWNGSSFDTIPTGVIAGGGGTSGPLSYIVQDPANPNQWIMYIKQEAAVRPNETYIAVPLSKTGSSGGSGSSGSIGLLGIVTNADPTQNISLSSLATVDSVVIEYWYISAVTDTALLAVTWNYQKNVAPQQVLSTLRGANTALVVSTDLTLAPANLKLKNSKGDETPLAFGTPQLVTGLLTRAEAAGGPVYLIPVTLSSATYSGVSDVTTTFGNRIKPGAVYYLEDASTGVKSNYSSFSLGLSNYTSVPPTLAVVDKINGNVAAAGVFSVPVSTNNTIGFSNKYVYDYYVEPKSTIVVNNQAGTFSSSAAGLDTITVHALYVDGIVRDTSIYINAY
jgi:hypothetical protein